MKNYLFFLLPFLFISSYFGQVFNETQKLVDPVRGNSEIFGFTVDIFDGYVVAGVPGEVYDVNEQNFIDSAGCAHIYKKSSYGVWVHQQKITASDRDATSAFGSAVVVTASECFISAPNSKTDSLFNNSLVGGSGAVYVYKRVNGTYIQTQKITALDRDGGEQFGSSIDVQNDWLVVGAREENRLPSGVNGVDGGAVYIYKKNTGTGNWDFYQEVVIPSRVSYDALGNAVAIDGDVIVVGDNRHDNNDIGSNLTSSGAVYVFRLIAGVWTFEQKLTAPTPRILLGAQFGYSLDVVGNRIVVGAPEEGIDNGNQGVIYPFSYDGSNWIQSPSLIEFPHANAPSPANQNRIGRFGLSLVLTATKLLVGAPVESCFTCTPLYLGAGTSFLYNVNGVGYSFDSEIFPATRIKKGLFGAALALDGGVAVFGAFGPGESTDLSNATLEDTAGAVYVFEQCIHANIPEVTSATNNLTICSGDSVQLVIDISNTLNSSREWFWYTGTYGSGTLVDSTDTVWVKPTVSTTYSVAGEGYCVGAGLSDSVGTVTVTVIANPNVSVVASPNDTICAGESLILTGSGASSYVWDNGVSNGVSFIPTSNQTYKVVGTSNGCKDSTTIDVVLLTNPVVSIVSLTSNTICSGTAITLSGSGAVSYTWNNGVADGVSFTPTVTQTYEVTGTSGVGCTDTESITVTVVSGPTVTASAGLTTVCAGTPVSLSASGADVYSWDNGGGAGSTVIVTPNITTDYTVTGTQTSTNCTDASVITITVNPLPSVVAISTPNDTLCLGENLTLTGSGASTYSWNNGVIDGIIFTPSLGQVQYILTGTDLNNCVNRDTVNVRVTQPPTIGALGPLGALCSGDPATLTGTGATTYVWDNGVVDGVSFTPPNTQLYTVIGTDANNCTGTASIQLTVNQSPNVSAFSSAGGNSLCEGDTLTLTATGNGQSYSWDNNVQDASPFIPSVGTNVYIVTATSANSCTSQASVTVVVNEQEDATITPLESLCGDVEIQTLIGVTPNGLWQGLGIINSATGEFDASIAGEGSHEIIYTTTGICNDADTISIEVFQELIVNTYGDSVCFGDMDGNIRVEVIQGVEPYSFLWATEETTPSLSNIGEGVYQVFVQDANNCIKDIDVIVFTTEVCNYHVFLPNIFSPNGDGINDELLVRGKGFESLEFFIFDRWGNKMFESTDKEKGWDGTNSGKKVAAGVYVYYVSIKYFDGSVITKEGNVSVSY